MIRVCLDAGHYGKFNRSPGIPEYYESEMNWKLHLMLKEELEKFGIQVVTTREDPNKDLDLWYRGQKAKGCDLFISLHSNAAASNMVESIDYPVACVYTGNTAIDKESQTFGLELAKKVASIMGTKQDGRIYQLVCDRNGDGIQAEEYYGVLWGAKCAGVCGVIIEHSFHTNSASVKWLLQESNLRRLAVAEAQMIANHFGVKNTSEVVMPVVEEKYRVQVGAFRDKGSSLSFLAKLIAKGWIPYYEQKDGIFRLYIGKNLKWTKAEQIMAKLSDQGFVAIAVKM